MSVYLPTIRALTLVQAAVGGRSLRPLFLSIRFPPISSLVPHQHRVWSIQQRLVSQFHGELPRVNGGSVVTGYQLWMDDWQGGGFDLIYHGPDRPHDLVYRLARPATSIRSASTDLRYEP